MVTQKVFARELWHNKVNETAGVSPEKKVDSAIFRTNIFWKTYERLLLKMKPTKGLEFWQITDSKILQTEREIKAFFENPCHFENKPELCKKEVIISVRLAFDKTGQHSIDPCLQYL